MKIGFISDMHLEIDMGLDISECLPDKGDVDVLVVAGDATSADKCFTLCSDIKGILDVPVIFVPGNHEYYTSYRLDKPMSALKDQWLIDFSADDQIHFLDDTAVTIGDISFFGSTWWSNFSTNASPLTDEERLLAKYNIADFRLINRRLKTNAEIQKESSEILKNMRKKGKEDLAFILIAGLKKCIPIEPLDMMELNRKSVQSYQEWYKATQGKKVLISHFPMLETLQHPKFPPNKYFVSNDRATIEDCPPDLLIFGHTHWNMDLEDAGTRCVSNMFGYPNEVGDIGFDRKRFVDL